MRIAIDVRAIYTLYAVTKTTTTTSSCLTASDELSPSHPTPNVCVCVCMTVYTQNTELD